MKTALWILLPCLSCTAGWLAGTVQPAQQKPGTIAAPGAKPGPYHLPAQRRSEAMAAIDKAMKESSAPGDLAREYAGRNPQAFFEWLLKCRPQPDRAIVETFFAAWIASDPDAAFTAAMDLPSRFGFRDSTFFDFQVLHYLPGHDARAAFRWAGRIQGQISGGALGMGGMLQGVKGPDFTSLNPSEIAAELNASPGGSAMRHLLARYTDYLAKQDLTAARAWAESLAPELRLTALSRLLWKWANVDSAAALKWLETAPSQMRQDTGNGIVFAYAQSNPQAGLEWVDRNMGAASYSGINSIIHSWAGKDPEAATAYVLAIDNPQQKPAALNGLAEGLCFTGRSRIALDWSNTLPEPDRLAVLPGIISLRLSLETSDFCQYLEQLPAEDSYTMEVAAQMGQNFGKVTTEGGQQLFQWAGTHSGAAADRLMQELMTVWTGYNRGAATKAVEAMPPGPRRDFAAQLLKGK